MTDGGQHIGQLAVLGAGVVDIVGDHHRQPELIGKCRGLGDQPVVVRCQVVRQLDEEPAATRPVAPPVQRGIPFRHGPGARPVADPQAPDQFPVSAPGQGDQPLDVVGQERLAEARHALGPGHVRLRDEATQAAPACRRPGQQDEVRTSRALADPAQVFLDRLAMPGESRAPRSRPGRETIGRAWRRGRRAAPAVRRDPGTPPSPGTARRDHHAIRIRDGRIQQFDLHADDRMQADRLGGADEPDRAVEACVIRDGKTGQAQLNGPRHKVVRCGRSVEEREIRVTVELSVRDGCHESLRS